MPDIVPRIGDRPAGVTVDGWFIHLPIHDDYYLTERDRWKKKLAAAHPDSPTGSDHKYRLVRERYDAWQNREKKWYRAKGLEPPEHGARRSRAPKLRGALDDHLSVETLPRIVMARLLDGRVHTLEDLRLFRGRLVSRTHVCNAVSRLRDRGAVIVCVKSGPLVGGYILIDSSGYHAPHAYSTPARLRVLFDERPLWTRADLMERLAVAPSRVARAVAALRKAGCQILTTFPSGRRGATWYEWQGARERPDPVTPRDQNRISYQQEQISP